jgi:hypothetical protein
MGTPTWSLHTVGELRAANVDHTNLLNKLTEDVRVLYQVGSPRENSLRKALESDAMLYHNKLIRRVGELEIQVDAMEAAMEGQKERAGTDNPPRSQESELLSALLSRSTADVTKLHSAIALLNRRMDDAVANELVSAASKEDLNKLAKTLCTKFIAYKAADVTNLESQLVLINSSIIALQSAATCAAEDCCRLRSGMDEAKAARAADGLVMADGFREASWAHTFLLADMHKLYNLWDSHRRRAAGEPEDRTWLWSDQIDRIQRLAAPVPVLIAGWIAPMPETQPRSSE